jgi:flagellar basal body-associated protein FliL
VSSKTQKTFEFHGFLATCSWGRGTVVVIIMITVTVTVMMMIIMIMHFHDDHPPDDRGIGAAPPEDQEEARQHPIFVYSLL